MSIKKAAFAPCFKPTLQKISCIFTWFSAVSVFTMLSACNSVQMTAASSSEYNTQMQSSEERVEGINRAQIHMELALGYLDQGKPEIALNEIKKTLAADPNSAPALNAKGLIQLQLRDATGAQDSFNAVLRLLPNNGNALHNLGLLALHEEKYTQALTWFDKALQAPNYGGQAKTQLTKAVCFLRMGNDKDAQIGFLRAFELDATNPIATFNLARLFYKNKEWQRAQFYIKRLNASDNANSESIWLQLKVERKMKNHNEVSQLGQRLKTEFSASHENTLLDQEAFYD